MNWRGTGKGASSREEKVEGSREGLCRETVKIKSNLKGIMKT